MLKRPLEASRQLPLPAEALALPANGPFAFFFAQERRIPLVGDGGGEEEEGGGKGGKPEPSITFYHTTGHDSSSPNPLHNEEFDMEYDD
ncbi:hypothetical protein [Thermogemmatispora tikiterensis]|uniref:Uncharacterized protein n=1 Tax=Thermogemmatispora tikiterensis TaxID=1825093 RepID=A0A328VNT1_9CHLR|nr:hypothetical protein [Thermogemmatispora tikiterensis]RAQ97822.1 hypothetical protein A4R35_19940 [Thermogemmatispora tikiterensis]